MLDLGDLVFPTLNPHSADRPDSSPTPYETDLVSPSSLPGSSRVLIGLEGDAMDTSSPTLSSDPIDSVDIQFPIGLKDLEIYLRLANWVA